MDYAFSIVFSGPDIDCRARIEAEFTISDAKGSLSVDPETQPALMGEAFAKIHMKIVTRAIVTKGYVLKIDFDDGTKIVVRPHDRYEAWSMGSIYCPPGGFA